MAQSGVFVGILLRDILGNRYKSIFLVQSFLEYFGLDEAFRFNKCLLHKVMCLHPSVIMCCVSI